MKPYLNLVIVWFCLLSAVHASNVEFENISEHYAINQFQVISMVEDQEGFIWLGTARHGILKLVGDEVIQYRHEIDQLNGLKSNMIQSLWVDENRLWIGGQQKLQILDLDSEEYVQLSDSVEHVLSSYGPMFSYLSDSSGVWLGCKKGLVFISSKFKFVESYDIPLYFEDKDIEKEIHALFQDKYDSDLIWIGTRYGLKSFRISDKSFTTHENPPKWHNQFPGAQQFAMLDIAQFDDEYIWLAACWSGGLMRYNTIKDEWSQYLHPFSSLRDPNLGNDIYKFVPIRDSVLLFINSIGYGYFNLHTKVFDQRNISDNNIRDNQRTGYIIDRFGCLWYFGAEGVYRSKQHLDNFLERKKLSPSCYIKYADNEFASARRTKKRMRLSASDLKFHLFAINYPSSDKLKLRWRINGYQDDWQYTNAPYTVVINSLTSGRYDLEYQLAATRDINADTKWVEGETVRFQVLIPIIQRWWFIPAIASSIILLIGIIFRQRIKFVRKQAEHSARFQREIGEVKMSALNAQMNPHFLFNTMNSINHFILKNEPERASHYLTRFSRLIRQVLMNSRQNMVSMEDELAALLIYIEMEQLRFDEGFEFVLSVDDNINLSNLLMPPMIIQPFIENAIWHGLLHKEGSRILSLDIDQSDDNIRIIIRDNGIGRVAAEVYKSEYQMERKSLGMGITQDRINMANTLFNAQASVVVNDLFDSQKLPLGTEVILSLPLIDKESATSYS